MDPEEGEFVESGSFRVDRPRALEKLRRFQLGDPALGAFFWVRCAAASRASAVDVRPGASSFSLRFDGKPLTAAEMRDPYGALFEPGSPPRSRQLAFAMLWAMRLPLESLELVSGPPGRRLRLRARSLTDEALAEAPESGTGTQLTVKASWRAALSPPWPKDAGSYARACAMCAASVRVDGRPLPPDSADPWELPFEERGLRARLTTADDPWTRPSRSEAEVSWLGVRVETVEYPRRFIAARVRLDAAGLALDASQASLVRDGRLEAVLDAVAARERELLSRVLDGLPGEGPRAAASAACARQAALALLDDPVTDRRDALLGRLWDSPLFAERGAAPRSLAELDRLPALADATKAERGALAAFLARRRGP